MFPVQDPAQESLISKVSAPEPLQEPCPNYLHLVEFEINNYLSN